MLHQSSSSAAAAFASSASSSSCWTGWIVPRIVPKSANDSANADNAGHDHDQHASSSAAAQKSIHSITAKRRIDPSRLCPGRGPEFHPFAVATTAQQTTTRIPRVPLATDILEEASDSTSLDVFFYPPSALRSNSTSSSSSSSLRTSSPLHVRLDRSSQELVDKTLHRMVLSIQKQISKSQTSNKQQQKKKKSQRGNSTTSSSTVTVWKASNSTSDNDEPQWQRWNVEHCINQQLWSHAITGPLLVEVSLSDTNRTGSEETNANNTHNSTQLLLQVDACPPTIVAVETFEDFTARNFVGIPLVVEVQTLFATDVVVDWYIQNQLVCANSVSYTPRTDDIGKPISVLVTPIRDHPPHQQQDGNDNDENHHQTMMHEGKGYEQAYQFQHPVEALPENTILKLRQGTIWTNPQRRSQTSSSTTSVESSPLRILTYNILADQNAYSRNSTNTKQISYYPYVDIQVLDKARRMPLLLHEILSYQADVICLQEVDESIWRRLFRPVLEKYAAYQGYFSSKNAKGMSEGCALLWSLDRFESVPVEERTQFGLSNLIMDIANAGTNNNRYDGPNVDRWKSAASIAQVLGDKPELQSVIEERLGHVVQLVSLPLKKRHDGPIAAAPERILVGNTHLFYHPLGAHIRLMQMYAICRKFEEFQNRQSSEKEETAERAMSYRMVLCGDMNSSLRRAAGYLLIHRRVQPDHTQIQEHFNRFQWKDRDQKVATVGGPPPSMKKNMRVEHAEQDQGGGDYSDEFPTIELPEHFPTFLTGYPTEPEFTHYLDSFAGSLDHIFISQCSEHCPFGLAPFHSAPMPTAEDVTEHVAMPSEKIPSDHVSLVADLVFTKHHAS